MKIYLTRRMIVLLLLGISSGLPLALIGGTLQAWMKESQLSLEVIGAFALATLPSAFKFTWSPFLDRFEFRPFARLGRRQGWMVAFQLGLIGMFFLLSTLSPAQDNTLFFVLCLAIGFVSASQDIVIDAYRAELLPQEELGAGAGVAIFGYRVGMLLSGAFALYLSSFLPWGQVYRWMAVIQGIGIFAALFSPRPSSRIERPTDIIAAYREPLLEFFKRTAAFEILCFVLLFKIGDVMAAMFSTPFLLDLKFEKAEIAAVSKGLGLAATIVGSMVGGAWMVSLGMKRSLVVFGIVQASSILAFAALAALGHNRGAMMIAITLENLGSGLGTAAFTAFLTVLCNKQFTATQYALLTSFTAITRSLLGPVCGDLAESVSWTTYFVLSAAMAVPALVLVSRRYEVWVKDLPKAGG